MSISPLEAQRSTPSSSKSVSVNPNSDHHGLPRGVSSPVSLSPTASGSLVSGSAPPPQSHSPQECEAPRGSNGRGGRVTGGGSGRRSQLSSGNHLLNFQYHPISSRAPHHHHHPPPPPRRHRAAAKPYNKDLFLQANYKFVVFDSGRNGPTPPESMDPDKQLRWEDIVCLRYSTPSPVQCPICLEPPLCPQITSCGHIFCFPCILRYLLMGKEDDRGESWKKCPLCFVMISPKDLYTIFIESVCEYNVGDKVEFSLLSRHKDSNVPSCKYKHEKDVGFGCGGESYDPFSKFTFTSDVDLPVRKAITELDGWLVKADSGLVDDLENLPYVCAAMEHLERRKKNWDEHRASDNDKSADQNAASVAISTANDSQSDSKVMDVGGQTLSCEFDDSKKWFGQSGRSNSDVETCSDQSADAAELLESRESVLSSSYDENIGIHGGLKGTIEVKKKEDSYNFYQAADGQHIILHPLDMKCLLNHFGSYNTLPDRISGKILQLETVTQSEATRRRFRYLGHFSLTTTFQLCEIDLSESLPPSALHPFMDEIKKREKQRKQVARKEQREKVKAEAAMEGPVPALSSFQHSFHGESPVFSMDDFEALGTSASSTMQTSPSPTVVGDRKLFSSVTRLGYAAGHDSPQLKNEENNFQDGNQERRQDFSAASGSRSTGMASFANVTSRAKAVESLDSGKKGKKASRVLLSTASGRRY